MIVAAGNTEKVDDVIRRIIAQHMSIFGTSTIIHYTSHLLNRALFKLSVGFRGEIREFLTFFQFGIDKYNAMRYTNLSDQISGNLKAILGSEMIRYVV